MHLGTASRRKPVCARQGLFAWLLTELSLRLLGADPAPLPRAHSHNDYRHTRPLMEALEQGFGSVEADIWLIDGELRVGHDRQEAQPGRTLQKLYLDPLRERTRTRDGQVFRGMSGFMLLIDVKADSDHVWPVLKRVLETYRPMLTRFSDVGIVTGAVTVVLSGDRPVERVAAEPERLCGIDARVADLKNNPSRYLYPLVSDNWRTLFGPLVDGRLNESDRTKLRDLVNQAHQQGRRIRFWNAPDELAAWREMHAAAVDLINTDRLADLATFLQSAARPSL